MKIGILGTGNVGATLGRRFAEQGHAIVYGSRSPDGPRTAALLAGHAGSARVVKPQEMSGHAEMILLAVPFADVAESIGKLGDLTGKIVIDATNPLLPQLRGLVVGNDDSAGEQVARLAPGARVVKAFNTVGAGIMANPAVDGRRAFLPVCGNDPTARKTVIDLANSIGFDAVDFGPITSARYQEPLAMVWIQLAYGQGLGPEFALSLVRR